MTASWKEFKEKEEIWKAAVAKYGSVWCAAMCGFQQPAPQGWLSAEQVIEKLLPFIKQADEEAKLIGCDPNNAN